MCVQELFIVDFFSIPLIQDKKVVMEKINNK